MSHSGNVKDCFHRNNNGTFCNYIVEKHVIDSALAIGTDIFYITKTTGWNHLQMLLVKTKLAISPFFFSLLFLYIFATSRFLTIQLRNPLGFLTLKHVKRSAFQDKRIVV